MPYEALIKYPFVLLTGFLAAFVLTPFVRRLALGMGLVDTPGARRIHRQVTPLGGGIAVFLGFHVACAGLYLLPWAPFGGALDAAWWWPCFVLSGLLLLLGLVDDAIDLHPLIKLAGQVTVAALAYGAGMRAQTFLGVELPTTVDLVATVFWFVLIINAFNLIDGMDGLAAGLAVIASLGLAGSLLLRRQPADVLVLLGFCGACLGFLRYNFHPASIFLGDAGSMVLGFVLAAVALSSGAKGTAMATIGLPFLAMGVPVLDAALAVWRRTARRLGDRETHRVTGGGVMTPDADHMHHRLLRAGLSPRRAATWLYGLSLLLVAVGLLSMIFTAHALGIYILAFMAIAFVMVRHVARVELWESGRAVMAGLRLPPGRTWPMLMYPISDLVALAAIAALARSFAGGPASWHAFQLLWLQDAPLWVGLPLIGLFVARTYSRVWRLARISEYALLAAALATGSLLAAGLESILYTETSDRLLPRFVLHVSLSILSIGGIRVLPRVARDLLIWRHRALRPADAPRTHIMLAGAGPRSALFLIEQTMRSDYAGCMTDIVGLIDEDYNLHGRFVHGYRVLGDTAALETLLATHHVEEIVITAPLPEPAMQRLRTSARAAGVRVLHWHTRLEPDGHMTAG